MVTKRASGQLRLTEAEAKSLATEFVEALQQLSASNEQATPDEVAIGMRSIMRYFENRQPSMPKYAPSFMRDLLGPLIDPQSNQISIDTSLKKYPRERTCIGRSRNSHQ